MSSLRVVARMVGELLQFRLLVLLAAVTLAALSAAQLALPWLVKDWVEGPLVGAGDGDVRRHVVLALGVVVAIAGLLLVSRSLVAALNHGLMARLREAAMARVLESEPPASNHRATGELLSRLLQDVGLLAGFADQVLRKLLSDGLLALGAVVMMFVLSPRLALAAGLVAPVVALLLSRMGRAIRGRSTGAQRAMGRLAATAQEQLAGLATVKAYQMEVGESARFAALNRTHRRLAVATEVTAASLVAAVFLVAAAAFVAATVAGTGEVAAGRITYGGLLAFCMYAGLTVEPVRRLAETHGMLQRSLAGAVRLFELLDLPLAAGNEGDSAAHGASRREVPVSGEEAGATLCMRGLGFRYRTEEPVLEGVDLEVGAGERVAIVAASGGGKSTLARLLLRFDEATGGTIEVDGVPLRDWPLVALRRQVCVVFQEPFLFSGSLAENIAAARPGAPREAVEEAARLAGLSVLTAGRGLGLAAPVAEVGRDLSGGQRQRVALARAILREPRLLILDEATSALDGETEADVFASLEAWLSRRTVIVMAHRLSTIRRAGRIVVLEGGRVVGDGSFREVEATCSAFRELLADQLANAHETVARVQSSGLLEVDSA